ncbi:SDR family oxidoreductase [Sorangium sp. So ce321]|uniref:SDR family oxidoreductase n=1 Tax=Sorangium sp. So ce321 TaxID=3133300 RepID=UPI003F5F23B2
MASLSCSNVVVIGGSSGIGRAVATMAASEGALVTIAARHEGRLRDAAGAIPAAKIALVDVAREEEVKALFDPFASVDHVYLSASAEPRFLALDEIGDAQVEEDIADRLLAPLYVARHASKRMRAGGSITFTTSAMTRRPPRRTALLVAIAEAVHGLARALAVELSPVRVNVVAPGLVDTERTTRLLGPARAKIIADRAARIPAGPIGSPDDVALAVLYLMKSGYVTGQVNVVDGGAALV